MDKEILKAAEVTIKIETYWNVNNIHVVFVPHTQRIKIETYWNVNFIVSSIKACACVY